MSMETDMGFLNSGCIKILFTIIIIYLIIQDTTCLTSTGGPEDCSLWDEEQLSFPRGVLAVGGQVEFGTWWQIGQIG